MANDCDFTMRVVGRKRGPVKRMGDILDRIDKKMFGEPRGKQKEVNKEAK